MKLSIIGLHERLLMILPNIDSTLPHHEFLHFLQKCYPLRFSEFLQPVACMFERFCQDTR